MANKTFYVMGLPIEYSVPTPSKERIAATLELGDPVISYAFEVRGVPLNLADAITHVSRQYSEGRTTLRLRIRVMYANSDFSQAVKNLDVKSLDIIYLTDGGARLSSESIQVQLLSVDLKLQSDSHSVVEYEVSYNIL